MAKVIKSFSLDIETVQLLESYCVDDWDGKPSRSKLVNDAIRWYITGDVAELVENNEKLQKRFASVMIARDSPTPKRSWWRQILGF
jgi:metal-responsive CopG/Arc/MetJ family transcriptional regulator